MIFVDTSFWAALGNAKDARHDTATTLWAGKPPVVVTSNHVLGETWTLLNRRCGHRAAAAAAAIRHSIVVRVEHITAELEEQAWEWLARHDEREYSFVDATSFALMRKRNTRNAFAFNGDFSAAGFIELLSRLLVSRLIMLPPGCRRGLGRRRSRVRGGAFVGGAVRR